MQNEDALLLNRWVARRDADAFRELVTRYADFVFATCRRILRNDADAEDIVQECFLRLARMPTAAPTRALGGWLHTVATRFSLNRIKQDSRRRQREAEYAERTLQSSVGEDSTNADWSTIEPHIDDAIGQLPSQLRFVVIEHFLLQKTHESIAAQAGVSRRTVSNRAQRGVVEIRANLRRRGVVVSTVAITAALGALPSIAAPSTLVDSLGKIGLAEFAKPVLARASAFGVWPKILVSCSVLAALVVVLIVVNVPPGNGEATTGNTGNQLVTPAKTPAAESPTEGLEPPNATEASFAAKAAENSEAPTTATPPDPDSTKTTKDAGNIRVVGSVVDPEGRPVVGAKVRLFHDMNLWGLGDHVVEETTTNLGGEYRFRALVDFRRPSEHAYARDVFVVLATHPDHAIAWRAVTQFDDSERFDLTMMPAQMRTVTVVDAKGAPLEGATVWLSAVGSRSDPNKLFRNSVSLRSNSGAIQGTTDAGGKVVLNQLPKTATCFVASLKGYSDGYALSSCPKVVLTRGATVSGHVLSSSGNPLPNVLVSLRMRSMNQYFLVETATDGSFRLDDLPARGFDMGCWEKGKTGDGMFALSLRSTQYVMAEQRLQLAPGEVRDGLKIVAREGTLVRCQVIDSETGELVPGARVRGRHSGGRIGGFADEEGVFTCVVLNGIVRLAFASPADGVYVDADQQRRSSTVSLRAWGGPVDVTLKAPPIGGYLRVVSGKIGNYSKSNDGGVTVYASAGRFRSAKRISYVPQVKVAATGEFELKGVPAGRTLYLFAISDDRKRAGTAIVEIPEDPEAPVSVTLDLVDTVHRKHRLLDESEDPIAKERVTIRPMVKSGVISFAGRDRQTSDTGEFEIDGLIPGLTYLVWVRDKSKSQTFHRVLAPQE